MPGDHICNLRLKTEREACSLREANGNSLIYLEREKEE